MKNVVHQSGFSAVFEKRVGKSLREKVLLNGHSHFRIGGPADFFFRASTNPELKAAIDCARREKVRWFVMGGGSNLLFDDDGFRGLIVRNGASGICLNSSGEVIVQAGTLLSSLVDFSVDQGFAGLEFLSGIPGTAGGAVFGNAGAFGESIGTFVERTVLLNRNGEERVAGKEALGFGYRTSSLKTSRETLLEVVFHPQPGDPALIRRKVSANLESRAKKLPSWDTACAGSYFKNPSLPDGTRTAAGSLLEQVGAKDLRVGDAAVFSGHANIIINRGKATAREVLDLAGILKDKVRDRFGFELEEEVVYLPAESSLS